jgi:hypothetical protein
MRSRALLSGVVAILLSGACSSDEPVTRERTVAFDNLYGAVAKVPIFVTVDGGPMQQLTASCDAKACSFKVPLTNARHDLTVSVEQGGRRSQPSRVTLDTTNLP